MQTGQDWKQIPQYLLHGPSHLRLHADIYIIYVSWKIDRQFCNVSPPLHPQSSAFSRCLDLSGRQQQRQGWLREPRTQTQPSATRQSGHLCVCVCLHVWDKGLIKSLIKQRKFWVLSFMLLTCLLIGWFFDLWLGPLQLVPPWMTHHTLLITWRSSAIWCWSYDETVVLVKWRSKVKERSRLTGSECVESSGWQVLRSRSRDQTRTRNKIKTQNHQREPEPRPVSKTSELRHDWVSGLSHGSWVVCVDSSFTPLWAPLFPLCLMYCYCCRLPAQSS